MKKFLIITAMALAFTACESISAKGEHGSISLNDNSGSHKNKPKGNAYGHNNPKNPHYSGSHSSSSNEININF